MIGYVFYDNRAPVAHLIVHRAVTREVVSRDSDLTNTQGPYITEKKVLPL